MNNLIFIRVRDFMVAASSDGQTMHIAYRQSGVGSSKIPYTIDKMVYGLLEDPSLSSLRWCGSFINEGELRYPVITYGNPRRIPVTDVINRLSNS